MIKIAKNENLRQRHIEHIVPKLQKYLEKLPHSDCTEYIRNNLESIVGATANMLDKTINSFNRHCHNGMNNQCLEVFTKALDLLKMKFIDICFLAIYKRKICTNAHSPNSSKTSPPNWG